LLSSFPFVQIIFEYSNTILLILKSCLIFFFSPRHLRPLWFNIFLIFLLIYPLPATFFGVHTIGIFSLFYHPTCGQYESQTAQNRNHYNQWILPILLWLRHNVSIQNSRKSWKNEKNREKIEKIGKKPSTFEHFFGPFRLLWFFLSYLTVINILYYRTNQPTLNKDLHQLFKTNNKHLQLFSNNKISNQKSGRPSNELNTKGKFYNKSKSGLPKMRNQ
jgi:hypothetical protein